MKKWKIKTPHTGCLNVQSSEIKGEVYWGLLVPARCLSLLRLLRKSQQPLPRRLKMIQRLSNSLILIHKRKPGRWYRLNVRQTLQISALLAHKLKLSSTIKRSAKPMKWTSTTKNAKRLSLLMRSRVKPVGRRIASLLAKALKVSEEEKKFFPKMTNKSTPWAPIIQEWKDL